MEELGMNLYNEVSSMKENGNIKESFYQFITEISKQFQYGVSKAVKLVKKEAHHRSCI